MNNEDLHKLQAGKPPLDEALIEFLTVSNIWLENMKHYCLDGIISNGGCKVKILHGDQFTGKSHYAQYLRINAIKDGFFVVMFDIENIEFKLTDIVSFYKNIASNLNQQTIVNALLNKMLRHLGYSRETYDQYHNSLHEMICELESAPIFTAKQNIRRCINEITRNMDIGFSFRIFLMRLMEAISENDESLIQHLFRWVKGEKLIGAEKRQSQIYENLNKSNARILLYSLSELLKLADYKGMLVIFDHFESVLPQFQTTVKYSNAKRNDIYEMLRQIIDDLDFLNNFLLIIAGNTAMLTDELHGLQSYQALWMRIQQSYKQDVHVNPYADLIDAGLIMKQLITDGKMNELAERMEDVFKHSNFKSSDFAKAETQSYSDFRTIVTKHSQKYSQEL